ncbi:MAG TPA: hypothetical protein VHM90_13405, partial [Phycisphaerae bacterium]|nr:hypothetical protein [Phycisphaerae bacterium]
MATTKDANNVALNLGTSWVGGITPQTNGDIALFDGTFNTGNPALSLGGNVTWLGIQMLNPVQDVTIGAGSTLTLGSSGIDTTFSSFNLTLNPNLQLTGTGQTWTAGGPLLVGGAVNLGGGTLSITTVNSGTVSGLASVTGSLSNGSVVVAGAGITTLAGNDNVSQIIVNSGTASLFGSKTIGSVTLNSGLLNVGGNAALGTGRLILNGGTIDNLSGAAVTLNTIPITLNGNVTFAGSNNLNTGLGSITVATASTLTVANRVLTLGTGISTSFNMTVNGAGTLNLAPVNTFGTASTFTLGGTVLVNITGTSMIQAGTFAINGGRFDNTSGAPMTLNIPVTFGGNSTFGGSNNLSFGNTVAMTGNSNLFIGQGTVTIPTILTGGSVLTESGTGQLLFTGSQNTFNAFNVGSGTMKVLNSRITNNAADTVGSVAGVPGVLIVDGGTITSTSNANPALRIGSGANGMGVVKVTNGGVLSYNGGAAAQVYVGGNNGGAYASLNVSNGGSFSNGYWLVVGFSNDRGIVTMTGGSITANTL